VVSALTVIVILNASWIAGSLSDNEIVVRESIRYIYISLISEPFMPGASSWEEDWRGRRYPERHGPDRDGRVAGEGPLCYGCVAILGLEQLRLVGHERLAARAGTAPHPEVHGEEVAQGKPMVDTRSPVPHNALDDCREAAYGTL